MIEQGTFWKCVLTSTVDLQSTISEYKDGIKGKGDKIWVVCTMDNGTYS